MYVSGVCSFFLVILEAFVVQVNADLMDTGMFIVKKNCKCIPRNEAIVKTIC